MRKPLTPEQREKKLAYQRAWYAANSEAEKAKSAAYRAAHPDLRADQVRRSRVKHAERYRAQTRKRRGIVDAPGTRPTGPCEMCGQVRVLDCDHSHKTGAFRGWLCRECNTGLGLIEKPGFLEKAQAYLARP